MKRVLRLVPVLVVFLVVASTGSQTPVRAATTFVAAAPSNGMIAFARRQPGGNGSWALMTINPDGSGETQVDRDLVNAFDPVWSPDGNSFAYEVFPAGQIWVQHVGQTLPRALTGGNTRGAAWSWDGTTIAYIQYPPGNGVGTLMTMSSDGSNKQPVLVHGAEVTTTIAVTWAPTADIAATKADGALAVVAGLDCGSGYRQYGIYLIKVDGSCTTVANNLVGDPNVALVKNLSWSRDDKLAFVYWAIEIPSDRPRIFLASSPNWTQDPTPVSISADPKTGVVPDPNAATWSPDGNYLAVKAGQFTEKTGEVGTLLETGNPKIYIVSASGGTPRQITDPTNGNSTSLTYDDIPNWQPCTQGLTTTCRAGTSGSGPTKPTSRASCKKHIIRGARSRCHLAR